MIDHETKYLTFDRHELPGRKTPIWGVLSRSGGYSLGQIRWYGPWRQYCFWPSADVIFNSECLLDITAFIRTQMDARKRM